jgi:hypothetical protein
VIAVGTDAGTVATVRTFTDSDRDGTYETLAGEFQPFGGSTGGVRVAMGDFNGDGNDELVTAMGGGQSRVRIWAMNTDGTVGAHLDSFRPFNRLARGAFIAAGDLDNDGRDELAICRGDNGTRVHIYSDANRNGILSDNLIDTFSPFGPAFRGGTRIALGDTNGIAGDELLVVRGPGGSAMVKVYTDGDADRQLSDAAPIESFLAFAPGYTGGAFLAAGAIDGVNGDEIIVGRETGAPRIRVFGDADGDGAVGDDAVADQFTAGAASSSGVRVAAGDVNGDGTADVITGGGPGGSQVTIREDSNDGGPKLSDDAAVQSFAAYDAGYSSGIFVAFGEVDSFNVISPLPPLDILDDTELTTTITIEPGAGRIADLDISISLAQPLIGDLTITLTHASSDTTVTLFAGLTLLSSALVVRFDDDASIDILDAVPDVLNGAICGVFNLADEAVLSAFHGLDASGDWVLSILDGGLGGGGTLLGWALHGLC